MGFLFTESEIDFPSFFPQPVESVTEILYVEKTNIHIVQIE